MMPHLISFSSFNIRCGTRSREATLLLRDPQLVNGSWYKNLGLGYRDDSAVSSTALPEVLG